MGFGKRDLVRVTAVGDLNGRIGRICEIGADFHTVRFKDPDWPGGVRIELLAPDKLSPAPDASQSDAPPC
ncbi:MAG: hypothetical protein ACFE0P_15425 [Oceanicaulis sp.]